MRSSNKHFLIGSLNIPFIMWNVYSVNEAVVGSGLMFLYIIALILHMVCAGVFFCGAYGRSRIRDKIIIFGQQYREWINRDDC